MQKVDTQEDSSGGNDCARLATLSKAELEPIVVEAMREHRRLMESDQVVYDEWERSKSDCSIPFAQVESLEAECLARRKKTLAQQNKLSDLLDVLGYIPKVPTDCPGDSCPEEVTPAPGALDPSRSRPHG
ncbi:transcriptional regulator [Ensifer sp. ENS02]|uniref:transcriptional repressor TraM n=1 Tax=Ensifer sp. ENS02 TaxID=2769290 RepID=UPI00177B5421|nr:transcriptional repressor TraM [Ensifer sp. ENS02]MBD9524651.1 transcriptional regulator [Ensifer sp. ENS02]